MNNLSSKERAQILHMLCEGNSLRAVARMAGVSRNTVDKLLCDVGAACLDYQDEHLRNLPCKQVQCDEIWSFVYAKEKNIPKELQGIPGIGDVWTWTAIDADTKLVPCWHVGNRRIHDAKLFIGDLAGRLANRVQLTTDGHKPYLNAVEQHFGDEIDYGQLVKLYGNTNEEGIAKYRPGGDECIGVRRNVVSGNPDECCISTSYVERQNLTMRMSMRRFTRLTNAHSKKVENHMHAISLHFMFYNFARKHMSLEGRTPAMAAGVADHVWTVEEIANLAKIEAPKTRGPYQKRAAQISN
jgi:IS1 family transposase